jgi:hypothetical protein
MPTAIMIEITVAITTKSAEAAAIGTTRSQLYLRQKLGGC